MGIHCRSFAGQNLTAAGFYGADLTDADLTGAEVSGATFPKPRYDDNTNMYVGGITLAQLYSTASYQAHDLTGIRFLGGDLSGWNLAGQKLTNADFSGDPLTSADFTDANLTNANFGRATLTGPDFTGAEIRGAVFGGFFCYTSYCSSVGTGITPAQLYSTTSYQVRELEGIGLEGHDLSGWNLAQQNLANAKFGAANLTGATLRNANLTNVDFVWANPGCSLGSCQVFAVNAILTDADLTAADARGSSLFCPVFTSDSSHIHIVGADAIATNLIRPDGHIDSLDLEFGGLLVVRDYDGDPGDFYRDPVPPIPITIDQRLTVGPGGTLRMVFEADAWNSTISFAPGIPVTLGGTLELTFAATNVRNVTDTTHWTRTSLRFFGRNCK